MGKTKDAGRQSRHRKTETAQRDYLPQWDKHFGVWDGTNVNDKAADFS